MNVYQKLNAARDAFHSKELKKSGHNKFAGYQYFELGDFVVPALAIFKEFGLTSIISFGNEQAVMKIVNTEKPDEVIEITSPMSEANLKGCHPVQNLGAVQTYTRRYLWVAALEIVEHDAVDSTEPVKAKPEQDRKIIVTPTSGAREAVSGEDLVYLEELANTIITLHANDDVAGVLNVLEFNNLDSDQKIALWTFLPSNVRSAIKKASAK